MNSRVLLMIIWLSSALALCGLAADTTSPFQQGLVEEEANRNLAAAIQAYQAAIDQFDEQRKVASTAVFRLAECYRKLGQTNEAAAQYQRVVRDFADQTNLVTLSRKELDRIAQFRMRLQQIVKRAGPYATAAPDPQRDLLQQELKLVDQQLANKQAQVNAGVANADDLFPIQREILSLKRQLAALDAKGPHLLTLPGIADNAPAEPALADEETQKIQRLKALKANSPDLLNFRDGQEMAPLHHASIKGQLQVVRFLLEVGADPEVRRGDGCTPLHLAVLAGHKAVAEFLLSRGAKVGALNDKQATPLHVAAARGFTALAELLLDKGAEVNAQADSSAIERTVGERKTAISVASGTPLHSAAGADEKAMVDLLLDRKADVEARSPEGNTPLMVVVSSGRPELTGALLDAGADGNAVGFRSASVLHWAVGGESVEAMKVLLARKPKPDPVMDSGLTPLHLALIKDQKDLAELLLKAGADPNRAMDLTARGDPGAQWIDMPFRGAWMGSMKAGKERDGASPMDWSGNWTPLEYALANDKPHLVEILLKGGANPNLTARGKPPIFTAVKSPDLLRLLLANKADVKAVMESDYTPLHEAASAGSESVELLLAAGADVNAKSEYGPPLSVAMRERNEAAVEALLEVGADPNILAQSSNRSSSRWSPLHQAVGFLNQNRVRLLLACGANVNIKDSEGATPLHYAARNPGDQAHAMVALLLASGADVSARNDRGETALDLAEQMKNVSPHAAEIKALLLEAAAKKPPTP